MNAWAVSLRVSLLLFASVAAGAVLTAVLPEQHLNKDSREIINLCIGLVGTLAALVLGLLISSAKASFGSLALFSPGNATVRAVIMVCAMSASGAILLILEMDRPFSGWISASTEPLSNALAVVGR